MAAPTTFRLEGDHGRTIVSLLPHLNEIPWADIERVGSEVLAQVEKSQSPAVLVDLSALDYMGSAQVALVVRIYKSVKERAGTLVVANRHPMVHEVLQLAGLDKVFTIVDSREAGLKLLGGRGSALLGGSGGSASSGGRSLALLGLLAVGVSLAGLVAVLLRMQPAAAVWVEFLAAGLAFAFGLMAVLKSDGAARTTGLAVIVASVALLLASVFQLGAQRTPTVEPTSRLSRAEAESQSDAPPTGETPPARDSRD